MFLSSLIVFFKDLFSQDDFPFIKLWKKIESPTAANRKLKNNNNGSPVH